MKRTISIILAGLLLLTMAVSVAYGQLGTTDNSSFTVQNLSTDPAIVTVTFYDETGTPYTPDPLNAGKSNPFTLDPGESFEVYLPGITDLPDGRYSVVISADKPIVAIANLIGKAAGAAGPTFYNGSYSGFEAGDIPLYLPSVLYEAWNWNSLISVQNVGANPTDITINIYFGANVVATKSYSNVPPSTSVHLDLETEGAGLGLTAGFIGSAVVTSSAEPIVATDNQTADGGSTQSYNGFLSGARTLYVPALYNDYYTWNASLNIQNIGAGSTDVTVTYSDGDTSSFTLAPNESELLYMPKEKTLPTKLFAATITSTAEDIVAIVNAAASGAQAQTYNAFATGTDTVGFPTVMNDYYGWSTSFTIQNIDTYSTTTVTYSYSDVGCPGVCTFELEPGESREIYQPDAGLSTGYRGSVTATSSGGVPIAGITNEANFAGQAAGTGDWSMSYNGFNQ